MSFPSSTSSKTPKTPHRSRRRKADKENSHNNAAKKELLLDDDDIIFKMPADNVNESSSLSLLFAETLMEFRAALSKVAATATTLQSLLSTSTSTATTTLDESVIRVSLCFPQSVVTTTTATMHVQEHAASLVRQTRKLLQQATTSTTKEEEKKTNKNSLLLIAVHILRAVIVLPNHSQHDDQKNNTSRLETCIRLLHHLITTASEQFHQTLSPPLPDGCWKQLAWIALAGLEALQSGLLQYSCYASSASSSSSRIVRFQKGGGGKNVVAVPFFWRTPTATTTTICSSSSIEGVIGTMTLRQTATIALKACLAGVSIRHALEWRQQDRAGGQSEQGSENGVARRLLRLPEPFSSPVGLMRSYYTPWITFLADSCDEECIKDFPVHCKAAHRLLWDCAAQLKETSTTTNLFANKQEMEDACLHLRRHAIQMLVPPTETPQGNALIQESMCWELAGSYAWKAVSVYVQQLELLPSLPLPLDSSTALGKFHAAVGSHLDRFYDISSSSSSSSSRSSRPSMTVSYVEYCVYRALHCGIPPKLHSCSKVQNCWKLDLDKNNGNMVDALILSVALVGVDSKHQLAGNYTTNYGKGQLFPMCSTTSRRSSDLQESSDFIWNLIHSFESEVLPNWALQPEDTQNRYFKLLSNLALHRTILFAVKSNNIINNSQKQQESSLSFFQKRKALEMLSAVLSRCFGPLAVAMAKNCRQDSTNDKAAVAMFELAVECYVRPLSAFEWLSETCENDTTTTMKEEEKRYQNFANKTIQALHQMFFRNEIGLLPTVLLEKCAKSIALVARQRTDRSKTLSSITATLYSLPMYQHLNNNSSSSNGRSDYQLSARLAHLASAMQSSGLYHQAMVVLACVIAQELPNCYDINDENLLDWKGIDFVNFLAARSKNVYFPISTEYHPTALARSSIRRLIAIKQDLSMEKSRTEPLEEHDDDEIRQHAWRTFLNGSPETSSSSKSLNDIHSGDCPSVAFLLPKILFRQQPKGAHPPRSTWMLRSFLLYVDVMVELGASIQGLSASSSSPSSSAPTSSQAPWQVEECMAIAHHLQGFDLQGTLSPNFLPVLVKVACSTSLIPSQTVEFSMEFSTIHGDKDQSRNQAIRLACDGVKELDSRPASLNGHDTDEVCWHLLGAVFAHFCFHLDGRSNPSELFRRFQRSMVVFRNAATCTSVVNDPIHEFCRKSILWSFSHFQIQLESDGDTIRSVIVTHWILELLDESDTIECAWFKSTAASSFLAISPSKKEIPHESIHKEGQAKSMEWFAQTEFTLASLRAQIRLSGADGHALLAAKRVEAIKAEIVLAADILSGKRDVISQWLLCSAELTLAESAAAMGSFTDSLKHLQGSCRYCMAVASSARSSPGHAGDSPLWENVARSTLHLRANQRYAELLCFRSKIYSRIGDYRKAIAYLGTLADFLGIDLGRVDKELGPDVEAMLAPDSDLGVKQFRRLNAEIRCSASSLDLVANGLDGVGVGWPQQAWSESYDVAQNLHVVLGMLSVGDLVYGESIKSPFQNSFPEFYKEAIDWYTSSISSNQLFDTYRNLADSDSTAINAKMAIREIRCLLHLNSTLDQETRSKVRALSQEVWENVGADSNDRAWAYLYAADLEIAALRQSGGLGRLWSQIDDESCEEEQKNLQTARDHLTKAAACHVIGSDILSRIILRSLALVTGPETGRITNASSGSLVLMSIGQSYRQLMVRSLSDSNDGTSKRVQELLDLFSICENDGISESGKGVIRLLDQLAEVAPVNWKFVAATLCPSGDLLVTSIENDFDVGEMRVRTNCIEPQESDNAYDDIMVPLDEIILQSQNQLHGMDVSAISERFSKEEAKREWWDSRHRLDEDLQALLKRVEGSYFPWLHLDSDSGDTIFRSPESMDLPRGNLASKFEEAVEKNKSQEETAESLQKFTVPKLKECLRDEFGFSESTLRKLKKQDLIKLILSEGDTRNQQTEDAPPSGGCLFLILDENLHRFPFEGMPSLFGHSVCRVPSLSFVLASLLERHAAQPGESHFLDPSRASFVLDPESNLISSRKRLKPVLDNIAIDNGWEWDSAIGEIPPASFFEDGLLRQDSVFMYFGHGGAQTCYSRKQVESLMCQQDGHDARACSAAVILMGCSSGRLVSVNRKHSNALEQIPLYYEPEGIALSYLCAGAPCVVGNLWDVTDNDIDRYSTMLLEKFLQGNNGRSLASCVAISRTACKLRFIVGCAPVCYGIPVHQRVINK